MRTGLRIRTFIYALFFCVTAMGGMICYADNKIIIIDNIAQDQVSGSEVGDADDGHVRQLRFKPEEEDSKELWIPLQADIKAEDVTMENHYMDREIWIYIRGTAEDYYEKEAVSGNISQIGSGTYEHMKDAVLLKFSLSDVYESKSYIEDNYLHMEFVSPWEMYDRILVIDAGCGGEDTGYQGAGIVEKELTLDIVKRLRVLLEQTDIKVYYTRMEDRDVSEESRAAFANAVRADMLLSVRLNESGDADIYGTEAFYNKDYFIPGFGNVELADLVERNVVMKISGRGNGLYPAGENDILLQEAQIPAAVLRVGYISNEQEARLLLTEAYREWVAEGLYEAILSAYEQNDF